MFKKSTAARENVKLKIGLSGPSGAGKTYSALQLAYGITGDWSRIMVADTENKSALYYAHFGPWQHVPFNPDELPQGYHPNNWVRLIQFANADPTVDVLILDSISHEWEGKGGCLDIVDRINKGFAGWKTVTPLHNAFIDAMRHSRLHIIACMRSKQDYVVEQSDKGKATPKKVGLKSIQREGAEYEFGVVFDAGMNHHVMSSKDRTGLFAPRGEFQITPDTGREMLQWATSGVDAPEPAAGNMEEVFTGKDPAQGHRVADFLRGQRIDESVWEQIEKALLNRPFTKQEMAAALKKVVPEWEPIVPPAAPQEVAYVADA